MQKIIRFFSCVASGVVISFFALIFIFINQKYIPYELFLQEALPFFQTESVKKTVIPEIQLCDAREVFKQKKNIDDSTKKKISPENNKIELKKNPNVIQEDDIEFQNDSDDESIKYNFDLEKLKDINYLTNRIYNVDKRTKITAQDFDVENFLNLSMQLKNKSDDYKILIFHTHSSELYSDSKDISEGVIALGEKLNDILNNKYNIKTLHNTKRYDLVNGVINKRGAYERMEEDIQKVIQDNPSIEVAIDIHRDGVENSVHLIENINNKPTAKIMFVNGLCKIIDNNNNLTQINNLINPYIKENLAFSFKMQMGLESLYPKITRKIYIHAYRYSLHMLPKSLLVEIGAQTNTKQEALNAIEPLAEILYKTINNKSNL
jgi:stage II sporulation protein P